MAVAVDIVIDNYNYGRFLGDAVGSALAQTHPATHVIVVDDGSDDDSLAVLARFGDRIEVVAKANGGQASALNAGLDRCRGDIVMFLDADDELHPGTAAAVSAAFAEHPGAARVVFRLDVVDEHGHRTGATAPAAAMELPHGDVRAAVLAFPDDLAWPPTSGNAFAAWVLDRLMPLPVDDDPTGADSCLHPLVPLFGPVVEIEWTGGAYRLHGDNAHLREGIDVARSRIVLRRARRAHADLDRVARELGYGPARPCSVTLAAHRLVSLRLGDRGGHPIPGDTRWRALGAGLRAAIGRVDVPRQRRAAYAAYFVAGALGPARLLEALTVAVMAPVPHGSLARLVRR